MQSLFLLVYSRHTFVVKGMAILLVDKGRPLPQNTNSGKAKEASLR
ncbi:hypothetical protein VCSRO5_2747 [Vibrio cholerae]|nr:hypothetical protein VCSRO5_2747 [Vibrio cholerae]